MSTVEELFAPRFLRGGPLTTQIQAEMAAALGADSLRYLPVESIARAVGLPENALCQACITQRYPTPGGQELYSIALREHGVEPSGPESQRRTYERHRALASVVRG
jgi:amidophosphoribosyltransferase